MSDYLTSFIGFFLSDTNQLWLMFFSGLLSSTVLPGNSEIVFSGLASQLVLTGNSSNLFLLWLVATLGNSLGSLTTYAMALLVPKPEIAKNRSKSTAWAIHTAQKYGVYSLLLSWLPVVGDLLCGVAGWLRLPIVPSLIFITLGKAARYGVILWGIWAFVG